MHVIEHVAMKRPIAGRISGDVKLHNAARRHIHSMLSWMLSRRTCEQFEKVSMDVDRVRHHGIVDQRDANALVFSERNWLRHFTEFLTVKGPHKSFHVASQV